MDDETNHHWFTVLRNRGGTQRSEATQIVDLQASRIEWDVTEQDALDMLTVLSLTHRQLDKTKMCSL